MNEAQVKHFIVMERQKGTTMVCQNMRYLIILKFQLNMLRKS